MTRDHAIWLRHILETAAQSLAEDTAIRVQQLYPSWAPGLSCVIGNRYRYSGRLWTCCQSHTAQTGWEPGAAGTESLFAEINETHTGTQADPIPYSGNMALVNGLYYMQDYETYKCVSNTIYPVYAPLSDLVGVYVERG